MPSELLDEKVKEEDTHKDVTPTMLSVRKESGGEEEPAKKKKKKKKKHRKQES